MKKVNKIPMLMLTCMLTLGVPVMSVSASSLDEVVNQTSEASVEAQVDNSQATITQHDDYTEEYIKNVKEATDLSEPSAGAQRLNQGISKFASFIVQVIAYFVTAFLVVRVILDLCYIVIPFTRSFLANGYQGNPQAGGGMQPGMQPGMGGMGGMGMGGMGMGGGMYGRGMMGGGMMGGGMYGRGGMGGMGMQQQGATPSLGRIQWVSTAALNAAAAEQVVGPDGKAVSPLKMYAKDMAVVLIITPILLTLAISGALTDLGFLIGQLITDGLENVGGMI